MAKETQGTVIKFNGIVRRSGYYAGVINIDNRIIVNGGLVKYRYPNRCQILPYSKAKVGVRGIMTLLNMDCNQQVVQAIVNGVKYEGAKIIVDNEDIYVDGKLMSKNQQTLFGFSNTLFLSSRHSTFHQEKISLRSYFF